MGDKMKTENVKVYIVISQTGTILSRIIKLLTRKNYNHASISLDKELNEMYSFGRLNPYNPFWGGFVHESIHYGTFKRFKNTDAIVLEIDAKLEDYELLHSLIKTIENDKDSYGFNIIGLTLCAFQYPFHKDKEYYCSEFVKDMLIKSNIVDQHELPLTIHPMDFLNLPHKNIYNGKLQNYEFQRTAV